MMNNKHNITASPLDLVMHMRRTKYKKVSEYIPKYNLLNFFEGNSEKLLFFGDKNFAGIDYWLQNSLDRKFRDWEETENTAALILTFISLLVQSLEMD